MKPKYLSLNDTLYHYICRSHSHSDDPILAQLRQETDALGGVSEMQISPEQGAFLRLLVTATRSASAIEVGTFTGCSSICIARGLPPSGRLLCIDESPEWTRIARKYWTQAGVAQKIELRLGEAISLLRQIEPQRQFDFAFIDAQKSQYKDYYELILPHVRPNGPLIFDNMLWGGRLGGSEPISDAGGQTIDTLNHELAQDPRVECVLLSIADGLQICRVAGPSAE